jgi:integrase
MQSNLFGRIRRLVSFNKDRAIAVDVLTKTLEYLKLLKPSETTISLDPKPIEPRDYMKLVDEAEGDDGAMMLCMMNFAMYLQETIDLRWKKIKPNGSLIAHRAKSGRVVRVATLWPETIEALAKVKRRGEFIFYGAHGKQIGIKGAEKRFRNLREAAKVDHVTSAMIRDGAQQAACDAGVSNDACEVLAGRPRPSTRFASAP